MRLWWTKLANPISRLCRYQQERKLQRHNVTMTSIDKQNRGHATNSTPRHASSIRQFRHLSLWTSQLLTVTTSSHYEEQSNKYCLWQKLDVSESVIQILSSQVPFSHNLAIRFSTANYSEEVFSQSIYGYNMTGQNGRGLLAPPPPEGYWRVGWSRGDRCALQRRVLGPWVRVA